MVKIPVTLMTKTVEASNSFLVDQETLLNSLLTSFKKFFGFVKIPTALPPSEAYPQRRSIFQNSGAAGLEPAVTVLETVGLPLTDAPKFNPPSKLTPA